MVRKSTLIYFALVFAIILINQISVFNTYYYVFAGGVNGAPNPNQPGIESNPLTITFSKLLGGFIREAWLADLLIFLFFTFLYFKYYKKGKSQKLILLGLIVILLFIILDAYNDYKFNPILINCVMGIIKSGCPIGF